MPPPGQRAATPGKQVVRTDNVKAKSWVDVKRYTGHIGQIFFATDDATLDDNDMALLETVEQAYSSELRGHPDVNIAFMFYGYADYRHTKEHNYDLSQRRADAVAKYLNDRLSMNPNYGSTARGLGVDYSVDIEHPNGRPKSSADLSGYRRVDIIAPPIKDPERVVPEPPKKLPLSTRWQARMKRAGSASGAFVTVDRFLMDIVDLKNMLSMEFVYKGVGFGASPLPIGASYSASPTAYKEFKVYPPCTIKDFEGIALHTNGQAQAVPTGTGATFDFVTLLGPHARRGSNGVGLEFHGFTLYDKNMGLGASQTFGTLEPSGDNHNDPRPWQPGGE